VDGLTVGAAASQTGWSPRMLRYLERTGLVVPRRTGSGYRLYGLRELNQLRSLRELRRRFGIELTDVAFAARVRRDPALAAAIESWLASGGIGGAARETSAWVDWEQRKHERLLAA
jgi:MerR family copper efflux transcriptional regulator